MTTTNENLPIEATEPQIASRDAQPYAAIRTKVTMDGLDNAIPTLIDETLSRLVERGVEPCGPPVIRYHVIDMERELDVSIGWLVDAPVSGDDRVEVGELPAGDYASLVFTDVTRGVEGNGVLIRWALDNGVEWDAWDTDEGHAFASRFELALDGPDDDPDPTTWRTEVAIKIAS